MASAIYSKLIYTARMSISDLKPELNPEHRLIPFETSPLPQAPWLVFAPHADDETYGMAGSKEVLVDVRHREVQAAARILGVERVDS